jgi:Cu+-exporting ATPase
MRALQPWITQGKVTVLKSLAFPHSNVFQLEYVPTQDLNIRILIHTVASSKPSESPFRVSLYKPPTLEQRARGMYEREQRALLHRLLFAVVSAIPTFIIAVVYMSLVSSNNATREWFMSPLWAGRASRIDWALLIIATPVYLYSCGIFHRRSVRLIRP